MLQLLFGLDVFHMLFCAVLNGSTHLIYLLLWKYMHRMHILKCICDVFEGEAEKEGFIVLFLCTWSYESWCTSVHVCVCACVCLWMNVDETEKAALCIAVHHRQYPCFSCIHIHTTFSYPLQKEGNKCKCIWVNSKERQSRKHSSKEKQSFKKRKGKKWTCIEKHCEGFTNRNDHFDLLHCNQCIQACLF